MEKSANNCAVSGFNLGFICKAQECSVEMQLTAARMHDHDVEMESNAERRRRLIRVRVQ